MFTRVQAGYNDIQVHMMLKSMAYIETYKEVTRLIVRKFNDNFLKLFLIRDAWHDQSRNIGDRDM